MSARVLRVLAIVALSLEASLAQDRRGSAPSVPELAAQYGYAVETHNVITSDGYQLTLHRLPSSTGSGKVAVLQHGITGSSADWLLMGPDRSLGLLLADSGYDVWLTNDRGNRYSRGHTSLVTSDKRYWDFSFHEVGTRDLPAAIDHVLSSTGERRVLLVAHSTGCSSVLAMCSCVPGACSKVTGVVAMAPPVLTSGRPNRPLVQPLTQRLAAFKMASKKTCMYEVPKANCRKRTPESQLVCRNFLLPVAGYRAQDVDKTVAAAFLSHSPSGTSIKAVEHVLQNMRAGKFQQFDYGAAQNALRYGVRTPPAYNLSAVDTKVVVVCSAGDLLSPIKDCEMLRASLPKVRKQLTVNKKGAFKHLDHVMSTEAKLLVYDGVVSALRDLDSPFDFVADSGVVVVSFASEGDGDGD